MKNFIKSLAFCLMALPVGIVCSACDPLTLLFGGAMTSSASLSQVIYDEQDDSVKYDKNVDGEMERFSIFSCEDIQETLNVKSEYEIQSVDGTPKTVKFEIKNENGQYMLMFQTDDSDWTQVIGMSLITITFNSDGGSEVPTKFLSKAKVIESPITTKENCVFEGWYHNGNPIDFSQAIYNDMQLVAHWSVV